ncbi:MAG TPA: histidinol-phosphatase HisJ family protein [Clostridiales bacterium]|nr:histidinol-phosphatase HisJ family protein [Clostridiales bacterium]
MIYTDYHLHSYYSSDCNASMESMIEAAIKLGLTKLCFTDHMDIGFPQEYELDFIFNCDDYFRELNELKIKYRDKIDILIGVELGLQPHVEDEINRFVENYPFDFILGSSHLVNKSDPYSPKYWDGISEQEGMRRYFQSIIDNCKVFKNFHVYGHLDYAIRYSPYKGNGTYAYTYDNYKDIIDKVLLSIISIGKGIEVNSSGYKYELGCSHPKEEIIKRYRELGGEIISIGSDAHSPEHLAYDFDKVSSMLIGLGFKYYTIFEKGQASMIKL